MYNTSWKSPGIFLPFTFDLVITGCGFDVYVLNNESPLLCTLTCPGDAIPTVAWVVCDGIGCCIPSISGRDSLQLQFVRHPNRSSTQYRFIGVTARHMFLEWRIDADNQSACSEALRNDSNYACAGSNSYCTSVGSPLYPSSYACKCGPYYTGNPYILDGCSLINQGSITCCIDPILMHHLPTHVIFNGSSSL